MLSFFALVTIQTLVALLFKVSQREAQYTFSPSSAQTTAEVIKLVISVTLFARVVHADARADLGVEAARDPPVTLISLMWARCRQDVTSCLALSLGGLASLYCFNNQLAFRAFRLADAATVTLVKSNSTAVSAGLLWLLLKRRVAHLQLVAIALQSLGLFVAQYDACKQAAQLPLYVYCLLVLSLLLASAAGVINEKLLKEERAHMHLQNIFLYIYGIAMNLAWFVATETRPFFTGYSLPAWGVIACQALLGVVITFVLKYADMTVRCLASACSVSALYAINIFALGFEFNAVNLAGTLVVFLSTYMYFSTAAPPESSADAAGKQTPAAAINHPPVQAVPNLRIKWFGSLNPGSFGSSASGILSIFPSSGMLVMLVMFSLVLFIVFFNDVVQAPLDGRRD